MSRENVELVRRMQETYAGPRPEEALRFFDPSVEFDATDRPDGRVWRGREGVRRAMVEWTGAWEDWEAEMERYIDVGDDKVLSLWRQSGRGKESGIPMEQRGANVYTVRDGRIVHLRLYTHREQALEAVGLRE